MKIRKTFLSVEIWRGLFSENGSERSPQTRQDRVGGGGGEATLMRGQKM